MPRVDVEVRGEKRVVRRASGDVERRGARIEASRTMRHGMTRARCVVRDLIMRV